MADKDVADVFAFPDFTQSSKGLGLPSASDDPFFHADLDSTNRLPEPADTQQDHDDPDAGTQNPAPLLPDLDVFDEMWHVKDEKTEHAAEFKTWDGFSLPEIPPARPFFITESAPSVYDAALTADEDPLHIKNTKHHVVQTNPGSAFFIWNEEKTCFMPDLDKMRISGYSTEILEGIQTRCLECGRNTRLLSAYVQLTYRRHPGPVRVALAKAVDILLLTIQTQMGDRGRQIRSLLRLQSLRLVQAASKSKTDEKLLSLIFRETQALESGDALMGDIMREVLSRASEPWIDFSEKWIGLKAEEGIPMTKDGPGKGFVNVENIATIDDAGIESEEPDYVLEEKRMPAFTGKNLRLLRTHHPEHPLSHSATTSVPSPPLAWHFSWTTIESCRKEVESYENSLLHTSKGEMTRTVQSTHGPNASQFFGYDGPELEARLLASIQTLNQPPAAPVAEPDDLAALLQRRLFDKGAVRDHAITNMMPHWSLIPLQSFGPLVVAQARMINQEYMKLLFSAHGLREHLRVQKEFHLLCNGIFCSRLSHALFDPELETAERQAGVAMRGGVMGLRLTARESWPPASSELRLALMGVLNESYSKPSPAGSKSSSSNLPGEMSFSIRDLSPEEIEKCLDPDSLEALDFLRLSYKTPAPLSPIIPPVILVKYDKVFKMLLRVLRMLYVVGQLCRDTSAQWERVGDISNTWLRFRFEAQHFVTSVSTYFFETGVEAPWHIFGAWLDNIESGLFKDNAEPVGRRVVSPDEVREEHEQMLDCIMRTLLLRKRQQPVLKLLEEIFGIILKFSTQARLEVSGKVEEGVSDGLVQGIYKNFRSKVGVFITVCRALSEQAGAQSKGAKQQLFFDGTGSSRASKEENTIDRLLLKLEMSGNSMAPPRNLTLTEELEKLEQSITLTLQGRCVVRAFSPTCSHLDMSRTNSWTSPQFWKQFFEASANVSLSGYEEQAGDSDTTKAEETALDESTSEYANTTGADDTTQGAGETSEHYHNRHQQDDDDPSLLEDISMTGSTPRPRAASKGGSHPRPAFAGFGSPYEALRREIKGPKGVVFKDDLPTTTTTTTAQFSDDEEEDETMEMMSARLPDMSMTPRARIPDDATFQRNLQLSAKKGGKSNHDLLLHRVLNKNYRLQATPHKGGATTTTGQFGGAGTGSRGRSPGKRRLLHDEEDSDDEDVLAGKGKGAVVKKEEEAAAEDRTRRALWADSPQSSPEMAPPQLRSDLYRMSPVRRRKSGGGGGPRTPGVSVQTPAAATGKKRDIFASVRAEKEKEKEKGKENKGKEKMRWDSDEDELGGGGDDDTTAFFGGMSPPKTIQFALPPSKLMQTPAREASRRIVDDILIGAGANPEDSSEYSPTMVKMNQDILDDTF
ncbi:Spc98 family-domain-containing protein [Xylariomycetidae sp. FL0641]|nr:Spc98 family-domain-containing protein [Xylariomycetidae sp. FL0641]